MRKAEGGKILQQVADDKQKVISKRKLKKNLDEGKLPMKTIFEETHKGVDPCEYVDVQYMLDEINANEQMRKHFLTYAQ